MSMARGVRTVTVVFTDIVGSTALSQRLDARTVQALRAAHFEVLGAEVDAVGATVVKNLGDGLMVVCPSPTVALLCAVAMQQAVDRANRGVVEPLAMRVGIATGDATEVDGDFFGEPVDLASRLCTAAQGGQILAADLVRAMAGRHANQEMVSVGALELKGIAEPVSAVEVRWEPASAESTAVALPSRLEAGQGIAGFVGRAEELAVLAEALKEAGAQRQRRLVLIGGEPGIGKSTLASVFARAAHADGSIVLYGRCDEDLGIPYQPWAEAVTHLVDHAPAGLLDDVVVAHGADLARLGPGLDHLGEGAGGGSADPETARYLLFGAVLRILGAAGAYHPVVLVLDDLQWADAQTLQLLRFLVGSDQALPVVVVATFRESDVSADHPLADVLAWLHRQPGVTRLNLRGLDDMDLLALMEAGAGHPIGEDGLALRNALARETDGNPFFVGELLRHLTETGSVYQDEDGRWTASGELREHGLPVSVREVIGRRVARLGDEAVRVLSIAAVIGRDFDLGVLATASDTAEEALLDVLDTAVTATLVVNVSGDRYSFAHALIEHALYDALAPARRTRTHRRVAETIEEVCGADPGPRVGELAYHYEQATTPAEATKAIAYARAAGDRALAQLAPADALRWYEQALGLLDLQPADNERLRAALLVGLGNAQSQTGHPGYRETLLDAGRHAQQIGDTDALVASALANNRGWFSSAVRDDIERVTAIQAALAAVGDGDSPARARLLALLAVEQVDNVSYTDRKASADQALAMARRLGDPATLLDVLVRRGLVIAHGIGDTLDERLDIAEEADLLALRLGDPVGRSNSTRTRLFCVLESADLAAFTRCVDEHASLAAEIGQPTLAWRSLLDQTLRLLLAGDADGAEVLAQRVFQLGTDTGQPDALAVYAGVIGPIRWHQGRLSELIAFSESLLATTPDTPGIRAGLARYYVDSGRTTEAQEFLTDAIVAGFPEDARLPLVYPILWAEVAGRLGDPVAAEMLYQRLAPWPNRVATNAFAVYGCVAHYLGHLATVLRRYDTAETHFNEALAIHERLEAPFHIARTRLEWGRMLIARNQSDDGQSARVHLESALDLAQRYGCALVERRAAELLQQL